MSIFSDIKAQKHKFRKAGMILLAGVFLFLLLNIVVARIFNAGLARYYCLQPATVLSIGHSMSEMGIDKLQLEKQLNVPVAKYCMNGAGAMDRLIMIKHYLETVSEKPEIIVYDVSARSFSDGLASNSYALFFPFISTSEAVKGYLREQASPGEYRVRKLLPLTRYDDSRLGAIWRGYTGDWKNRSMKLFSPKDFNRQVAAGKFWRISFHEDSLKAFEETVKFLEQEKIPLLLVALPCVNILNNAEPEKYAAAMDIFRKTVETYRNVYFVDYNPDFSGNYSLFSDPIHLNPKGQQQITARLAKDLKTILNSPLAGQESNKKTTQ